MPTQATRATRALRPPPTAPTSPLVPGRPRRVPRLPARLRDYATKPSPSASRDVPAPPAQAPSPSAPPRFLPLHPNCSSTPLRAADTRSRRTARARGARPDTNNNPAEIDISCIEEVSPAPTACKPIKVTPKKAVYKPESPKKRILLKQAARVFLPKLLNRQTESPKIEEKLAVYEFTFDPEQEPKVPNKKKTLATRKKAAPKPKPAFFKSTYNKKIAKQLEHLKEIISNKNSSSAPQPILPNTTLNTAQQHPIATKNVSNIQHPVQSLTNLKDSIKSKKSETVNVPIPPTDTSHYDDHHLNYSPVSSPQHVPETLNEQPNQFKSSKLSDPICDIQETARKNNPPSPNTIIEDFSFFDDVPVASSSLMSVRKSVASSPWRVECPRAQKWPVNMYVKPNMTPAYESTFGEVDGHFRDSSNEKNAKKHVYVDIDLERPAETNQVSVEGGGLKQTSILSFIKEVVEKQALKNKAVMPVKNNSIFDESLSFNHSTGNISEPFLGFTPMHNEITPNKNARTTSEPYTDSSNEKFPLEAPSPSNDVFATPEKAKTPNKKKKVSKYFGFDDSENIADQENASPVENIKRPRGGRILRARSRAVLKEVNQQKPMRMTSAVPVFASNSDVVKRLYEEIKSAGEEPIIIPVEEKEIEASGESEKTMETSEDVERSAESDDDRRPSPVGLFEDMEMIHHAKPDRKSYRARAHRVAFQKTTATAVSDESDANYHSSEEEDELTHQPAMSFMPKVKERRAPERRKKKQVKNIMTKKEEAEADAWAAGFNSMVEEVDEFPLLVE